MNLYNTEMQIKYVSKVLHMDSDCTLQAVTLQFNKAVNKIIY